ncbi:MAG TPA: helix-turn-helix domain-containing protein [Pyrinomonadaceae bacterium]|nr:helix-turn-helix domain-containing protein [Pyrinomonadaceae bacterium]
MGAAQGLLLSLALLSARSDNKAANRLLAALTFTISILVSGAVLLTSDYVFHFPHLSRLHQPFAFLAGPLLFLYIRTLTSPERKLEKRDLLHFIPFVLCSAVLLPCYFQSGVGKIRVLSFEYIGQLDQWYYLRSALFVTQLLIYLVLIALTIIRYSRNVKEQKSARNEAVLFEIRFFVIAVSLLWVAIILRLAIQTIPNLLVPLGASLLVYGLGYLKMRRPELNENDDAAAKKYEKSQLTPERSERYLNKLLQFMEKESPFTDGDLTISKLADRLSIPASHLSQTINERLSKSFPDFINSYRIEEAKKRLLDPARKHYTVLAIAEEVGFNSKSSFNDVFKRHVKMTPTEFRKLFAGPGF